MLTKLKIALVIAGSLVCGVAAAQGTAGSQGPQGPRPDFKAKKAEMLQKFDTNKDGKLDDAERTAAREQRTIERFKKLDTDGNGSLSLAEFKAGKRGGRHHARRGHGMHRGNGRDGDTK